MVPLLPIALALAVVTWWPRVSNLRSHLGAAPAPSPGSDPDSDSTEDQEDRRLAEAIDRVRASTLALEYNSAEPTGTKRRIATGVVFSPDGDVISVRVEPKEGKDRDSILARDSFGHEHPVRFVASDPETGLTLLKVEARDARPVRPTARAALIGAAVFLVGHPYDLGQSVSVGNVAGLNRRVKYGPRPLTGLIHVQVSLHPGDSGALLADRKGGWLGLIRGGGFTPDGKDDNSLGFAIPAPEALWIAEQLRANRKVDRAYLGVQFARKQSGRGALVFKVVTNSPAEKAGLQDGDRIVKIDQTTIRNPDDLTDRLDRIAAGTEVTLEYDRGSTIRSTLVRTTSRPSINEPVVKPSGSPNPSAP